MEEPGGGPPSLFALSGAAVSSSMGALESEVWGKGGSPGDAFTWGLPAPD